MATDKLNASNNTFIYYSAVSEESGSSFFDAVSLSVSLLYVWLDALEFCHHIIPVIPPVAGIAYLKALENSKP